MADALSRHDIDSFIRAACDALAIPAVLSSDLANLVPENSIAYVMREFCEIAASLDEAISLSFQSLTASLVAELCDGGGETLPTRSHLASRIAPLEQHFHALRRSLLLHFFPGWIDELGCDKCMQGDAGGGSCGGSSSRTSDDAGLLREGSTAPERRSSRLSALGARSRMSEQTESDESDQSDSDEAPNRGEGRQSQAEPDSKPRRTRHSSKRRKRASGFEDSSGARNSLPKAATHTLKQWLFAHFEKPYPTDDEKLQLSAQTGLEVKQINYYFINARVRIWKPMLANLSKKGAGALKYK